MFLGSIPRLSSAIAITGPGYKLIGPLSAGAKAARPLTFTGAGSAGETVTLGTQVYTLRVTPDDAIAGEVKIGVDATATVLNLKNAINGTAGNYSAATPANGDASAAVAAGVLTATARVGGAAGNSIVTTETSAVASWAGATLTGGADPDVVLEPRTQTVVLCNPNGESILITGVQLKPTKIGYVSDITGTVVGLPVTLTTPFEISYDGDDVPAFYLHCAETASFYLFYPEG